MRAILILLSVLACLMPWRWALAESPGLAHPVGPAWAVSVDPRQMGPAHEPQLRSAALADWLHLKRSF